MRNPLLALCEVYKRYKSFLLEGPTYFYGREPEGANHPVACYGVAHFRNP